MLDKYSLDTFTNNTMKNFKSLFNGKMYLYKPKTNYNLNIIFSLY